MAVVGFAGVLWQYNQANLNRDDAVKAKDELSDALEDSRRESKALRRSVYLADMNLAQRGHYDSNYGPMGELLDRYRLNNVHRNEFVGFEWGYLWKKCQGDQLYTLHGHSNGVSCVTYSRDGKLLAVKLGPRKEKS